MKKEARENLKTFIATSIIGLGAIFGTLWILCELVRRGIIG